MQPLQYNFWLVVWNIFYFSIYWEGSSQLTNIIRGVETTNQTYAVQLRKNIGKTTPELSVPLRHSETELLNTMELRARTSAKPRPNCQFHCKADPGMIPVQTNVFRNRPPDKLPHPYSEARFVLQNTVFRASAISQKRTSCETSLKSWKLKMWKRSLRARLPPKNENWGCENEAFVRDFPPSKSESGRCENEACVRDFHQKMKIEDVKTKLSCETSLPQKVKVEDVKTKLSCQTSVKFLTVRVAKMKPALALSVPLRNRSENDLGSNECVPQPSAGQASPSIFRGTFFPAKHSNWCTCYLSKTHFVRDFPEELKAEDVKTKRARETSHKTWKLRISKQSFRTRRLQNLKVEDVKTKLSCQISVKFLKVQMAKMKPALSVPLRDRSENDLGSKECVPQPSAGQACPSIFRGMFCPAKHSIWCTCYLSKMHFVRDFPQKLQAEDVKTKRARETSHKTWKLRMSKQSFRTRRPQNLKVEDVKTKLSCKTSLKKSKWKMRKRSFRKIRPSKSESGRCENEAFVPDFLQKLEVEDVKTKLSFETSLKKWKGTIWNWSSCATKLSCETSLLAVRSLGCEIFVIAVNRFFQNL